MTTDRRIENFAIDFNTFTLIVCYHIVCPTRNLEFTTVICKRITTTIVRNNGSHRAICNDVRPRSRSISIINHILITISRKSTEVSFIIQ